MLSALVDAGRSALGFDPRVALLGSAAAAMLLTRRPGPLRLTLAVIVLLGSWLAGGGADFVLRAEQLSSVDTEAAMLVLSAVASAALGWGVPVWAGVFVGKRVTVGTGWISAGVVSATVSGAIAALAQRAL